jgi:multidrug efflux pump subunit AcrA (membrane-fusion protein)
MKRKTVLLIVFLLAALVAGGSFVLLKGKGGSQQITEGKTLYYCPMHKEYVSDKPGNCPICSMKLVPKQEGPQDTGKPAGNHQAAHAPQTTAQAMTETGGIFIPPQRQQSLGVRTVSAEMKNISREIRTVGKIAYDETRIAHIHTRFNGWVENVFVDFVGQTVRRGQPLFTVYSPELVSTQQEYLLALRSEKQLGDSSFDWIAESPGTLAESAKARLRLWGISEREIEEVARTGQPKRALTIYSPVAGVVTQRAAYHHGMYVTPEEELYTIVDLAAVWLIADVYEKDLPFVRTGQTVRIEFPYEEHPPLDAKIDFFYPYLDPNTRTGQVRIQFPNPNYELKPDQFVNVLLRTAAERHLVVPEDAVLNTGDQQYVFVESQDGYFDPRRVQIGIQTKEGTAILNGLKAGERVAAAANFLLDSEARLRGALENMGKPSEPLAAEAAGKALAIQILEPKTAKTGENRFRISVKDPTGKPVTEAEVEVTLFMPAMVNMPAMSSKATLLEEGNGIYAGIVEFKMAWTWETTIVVRKQEKVLGTWKTTVTAR